MPLTTESTIAAERAILATCLIDPQSIEVARRKLTRQSFYRTAHGIVFETILALTDRGEAADLVSVAGSLRDHGLLEEVGGPPFLAQLMESVAAPANIETHARMVAEHYARRIARDVSRKLSERVQNGIPAETAIEEAVAGLERARSVATPDAERIPTFEAQGLSDVEMLTRDLPMPESLVGDRIVIRGGLTILAGHSGLGKTFLVLQLMDALSRGGLPWLGYTTGDGGSGLVEFEMPEGAILERIKSAASDDQFRGRRHFWIQPRGFSSIHTPKTVDDLSFAVERRGLSLLIFDSLNKVIPGDKNMEETIELGFNACYRIIARTGVSILLIHHFNKAQLDPKTTDLRDQVLLGLRGSARLQNDPDSILGLVRHHGKLLLVNAKTRYSPAASDIAVKQDTLTGWFSRVETTEQEIDRNRERIEKALMFKSEGATMEDLCRLTQLADRTVRRYLSMMGCQGVRVGSRKFYFAPTDGPLPQVEFGAGIGG